MRKNSGLTLADAQKIIIGILFIILLIASSCVSGGEKNRYYDAKGKYIGNSVSTETGTRYYNARGAFVGKSK